MHLQQLLLLTAPFIMLCSFAPSNCGSYCFCLQHAWDRQGEETWKHGNPLTSVTSAILFPFILLGISLEPETMLRRRREAKEEEKSNQRRKGPAQMSFISLHSQDNEGNATSPKHMLSRTTRSPASHSEPSKLNRKGLCVVWDSGADTAVASYNGV